MKFGGFGVSRSGHAGEFVIHAEIILERDRGQSLIFIGDFELLLRLQRLVQPIAIAPARHEATGELVDDDHLTLFDHIVHILFEQGVRFQGLGQMVQNFNVGRVVEIVNF